MVRDMGNTVGSLTREQESVIIGSLLGDGAMRCKNNALLEVNHCVEQREYVDWKYGVLRNMVRTAPKERKGNGKRIAYRFTTLSLPVLTGFYHRFYRNGVKRIPEEFALDGLVIATWFMDDGSKSRKTIYFNTQQFTVKDQKSLIRKLADIGLMCTLNRDKSYYRLWLSVESVGRFTDLVQPHMLPMFSYKLPG